MVEENFDIGGHGMLSGGRVSSAAATRCSRNSTSRTAPTRCSPTGSRHDHGDSRYSDRDLVRVFADENVPTFNFLVENGVTFIEKPIQPPDAATRAAHFRHP